MAKTTDDFYCVKCKKSRKDVPFKKKTASNGRPMHQARCPKCDTKMTKFVKGD